MRIALALLCTLVSFQVQSAPDINEQDRLCQIVMGTGKKTSALDDPMIRNYANEFLRHTDVPQIPVVLCVSDRAGVVARNNLLMVNGKQVLVVGVGRRLSETMGKHLRAIIAHEIGHVALGHYDGGYDVCLMHQSQTSCEYDVDRVAVKWVGKSAIVAAMKEVIQFLEYESEHQQITFSGVGELKERLVLLEEIQ